MSFSRPLQNYVAIITSVTSLNCNIDALYVLSIHYGDLQNFGQMKEG